jgi:D-arabinonate dehydratase
MDAGRGGRLMRIAAVESLLVRVPLRRPVLLSRQTFTAREFNVVRVRTDEGLVGVGYARGGEVVRAAAEVEVAPRLAGRDPFATETLWAELHEAASIVGRAGAFMRALSAVDIALWDVKAKALGLPLFRLLGGEDGRVPAYVSGGYYRDGQTLDDLARELAGYVERGFRAVKIRVARLPLREDVERVAAVRRAIGDDVELMVDANQGYATAAEATAAGRRFEQLGVRWLEEPVRAEDRAGSANVAASLDMAVATGETEYGRFAFRDLIAARAADILQPDATVVGGVSEWLKAAALASAHGLPVAPHYFTEVHAHLVAATPNAITVEYFFPDADIISFDELLAEPLAPRDGWIELPERPGVGLDLRPDALERYRAA